MSASPSEGSAEAGPPSPEQPEVVLESRIDNDMMEDPFLPPTLETRKRKKKSESAVTHEDSSASSERLNPIGDSEPAMKSGSKRKFSAEDDESVPYFVEEDDEFHFRRPSHSPRKQTESFEFARQDYSPTKRPADVKKNLASPTLARRKVLEPSMLNRPRVNSADDLKRKCECQSRVAQEGPGIPAGGTQGAAKSMPA